MTAYPNPFSSETTVEFTVSADEVVTLKVYSLTGVLVADLYEGAVFGGQKVTAEFSSGNLPSGIYFARLSTASGEETNVKLVLQK
jgi:hypothetical protein